jgi:hypothetical protein
MLAAALALAACAPPAAAPEPGTRACIAGLTEARARQMLVWAGDAMGVPGDVALPAIACAPPAVMAELYRRAGGDASRPLGAYDPASRTIWLTAARRWPDGNGHILAHELAHHLQSVHGLRMTAKAREAQADAVHRRWLAAGRP